MTLHLALLPSNQRNPVLGNGTEQQQMESFADVLAAVAARYPSVACTVVRGEPETDARQGKLPKLRQQVRAARAVLETAPSDGPRLALHLHSDSDSGIGPHVGAYYGGGAESRRLALQLVDLLGRLFGTVVKRSADYGAQGFIAWSEAGAGYTTVLLELGTHEDAEHVRRLRDDAERIAVALIESILGFYALPVAPVDAIDDSLNGLSHYLAIAANTTSLDEAHQAAHDAWERVVRLKQAIGR